MDEVWKDIYYTDVFSGEIIDYRGLYKINNNGYVYNVLKNKLISISKDKDGYEFVHLRKDGKDKVMKIHRLVAYMFVKNDNPKEKTQINHIDENKSNNNMSNLEWCTIKYNNKYGTRKNGTHVKKINMFTKDGTYIITFNSLTEASTLFNKNKSNLSTHLKGKQKTFSGFIFKYVDGDE